MVFAEELSKLAEPQVPILVSNSGLLKKYDIPIQHLDFPYIEKCQNGRELEKIYHVLLSGEEGYFPELMKRTEEKLKELKPNSRFLRKATTILKKENLDKTEQRNIENDLKNWLNNIDETSKKLDHFKNACSLRDNPPIRKNNKNITSAKKEETKPRIKSTDYQQWDKYDADTELLKIDLEEEKLKEELKKKQAKKTKHKKVRIKEYHTEDEAFSEALQELTKGNEYFAAGEFDEALSYYTLSVDLYPTYDAIRQRCFAYFKLGLYEQSIDDGIDAIEIEGASIELCVTIAHSYEKLEQYENAYEYILSAYQMNPNNKDVEESLHRIQNLLKVNSEEVYKRIVVQDECETNNNVDKSPNAKKPKSILKPTQLLYEFSVPTTSTSNKPGKIIVNNIIDYFNASWNDVNEYSYVRTPQMACDSDEDLASPPPPSSPQKTVYPKRSQIYKIKNNNNRRYRKNEMKSKEEINNLNKSKEITKKNIPAKILQNIRIKSPNKSKEVIKNETPDKRESINNNNNNNNNTIEAKVETLITVTNKESKKVAIKDIGGGGEPFMETNQHPQESFFRAWTLAEIDESYTKQAEILRRINLEELPRLIGLQFNSSMFSSMIQCLYKNFTVASEIDRVYSTLVNLVNVPRFTVIAMFANGNDKCCLQNLKKFLAQHDKPLPIDVEKQYDF